MRAPLAGTLDIISRGVQRGVALLLRPALRAHLSILWASSDLLPDAKATALRAKRRGTQHVAEIPKHIDIRMQEGPAGALLGAQGGLRTPKLGGPARKVCNTSRYRARLACVPRSENAVDLR